MLVEGDVGRGHGEDYVDVVVLEGSPGLIDAGVAVAGVGRASTARGAPDVILVVGGEEDDPGSAARASQSPAHRGIGRDLEDHIELSLGTVSAAQYLEPRVRGLNRGELLGY